MNLSTMETMYVQQNWRSYIVCYCLLRLHYQPTDLITQVVEAYHDMDEKKHYMVKSKKRDSCMTYVSKSTGRRMKRITSKKFMHAIQQLSWVVHPEEDLTQILEGL
jgi:hypothetical protein